MARLTTFLLLCSALVGCRDEVRPIDADSGGMDNDAAMIDIRSIDVGMDMIADDLTGNRDVTSLDGAADSADVISDLVNFNCDDLIASYVSVANPGPPPFDGTLFVSPDILTDADPTSFVDLVYSGQADRVMFDRRTAAFETYNAHLFDAQFGTTKMVEVQVNPEFSMAAAEVEARRYADGIGRMPAFLFKDLETVWIHRGDNLAGGGNNNLLIHTGQGVNYIRDGILEELFIHEAAHTSLEADHANAPAWLAAQNADGSFMSTYGRDNPAREDISETLALWLAVRFYRERIPTVLAEQIETTIPNRLKYLDCAGLSPDILK